MDFVVKGESHIKNIKMFDSIFVACCVNWPQPTDRYANEINRITWCIRCTRNSAIKKRVILWFLICTVFGHLILYKIGKTDRLLETVVYHSITGNRTACHFRLQFISLMTYTFASNVCNPELVAVPQNYYYYVCFFDHIQFHLTWDQPQQHPERHICRLQNFRRFCLNSLFVCVCVVACWNVMAFSGHLR